MDQDDSHYISEDEFVNYFLNHHTNNQEQVVEAQPAQVEIDSDKKLEKNQNLDQDFNKQSDIEEQTEAAKLAEAFNFKEDVKNLKRRIKAEIDLEKENAI